MSESENVPENKSDPEAQSDPVLKSYSHAEEQKQIENIQDQNTSTKEPLTVVRVLKETTLQPPENDPTTVLTHSPMLETVQDEDIQRLLEEKKRELLRKLAEPSSSGGPAPVGTTDPPERMETQETQPSQSASLSTSTSLEDQDFQRKNEDTSTSINTSSNQKRLCDEGDSVSPHKRSKVQAPLEETPEVGQGQSEDMSTMREEQEDWSLFRSVEGVDYSAITTAQTEFTTNTDNFLKGCKWSPDGSCVLTNSNDNILRVFNLPEALRNGDHTGLPEMSSAVKIPEGELIYDYVWYPLMSADDPVSCCAVSSSRNTPVHMWDTLTGDLRCSYRAFDQMDELTAAHSLAFSQDGSKLYCGFNKMIRVFDVARPGKDCQKRPTFVKEGQPGIISCIAVSPVDPSVYAAGSYSRSVALYSEPRGQMICMFQGHLGGVTHLIFSPDGQRLYTGGRKDPEILCWDLRNPGQILGVMNRRVNTNQRIYFDLDSTGQYLVSGATDGMVTAWDVTTPPTQTDQAEGEGDPVWSPSATFRVSDDTVNGVTLHPTLPVLATATGQRHFSLPSGLDSSDSETEQAEASDNCLRLHWLKRQTETSG